MAAAVEDDGVQDGWRRLCLSLFESNCIKLLAQLIPPEDHFNYANCTLDFMAKELACGQGAPGTHCR